MSIFEYRKLSGRETTRNALKVLRETLEKLNADPEETPSVVDLKRILTAKIAELERK